MTPANDNESHEHSSGRDDPSKAIGKVGARILWSYEEVEAAVSAVESCGEDVESLQAYFSMYEELRKSLKFYPLKTRIIARRLVESIRVLIERVGVSEHRQAFPHSAQLLTRRKLELVSDKDSSQVSDENLGAAHAIRRPD